MGVHCFDKDTPTNKSVTIQKTIKKGINRILSGVERYSNGSRYWKGAVKRGLEMVSDGVFKLNVAQGKSSVIGSGVAGIASTVKTLLC
jgi:hypothetical protein